MTTRLEHAAHSAVHSAGGYLDHNDVHQALAVKCLEKGWNLETTDQALLTYAAKGIAVDMVRRASIAAVPVAMQQTSEQTQGGAIMRMYPSKLLGPAESVVMAEWRQGLMDTMQHHVQALLGALTSHQRDVAAAYYLSGHSHTKAAQALGLSTKAVAKALERARATLGADAYGDLMLWRTHHYPEARGYQVTASQTLQDKMAQYSLR